MLRRFPSEQKDPWHRGMWSGKKTTWYWAVVFQDSVVMSKTFWCEAKTQKLLGIRSCIWKLDPFKIAKFPRVIRCDQYINPWKQWKPHEFGVFCHKWGPILHVETGDCAPGGDGGAVLSLTAHPAYPGVVAVGCEDRDVMWTLCDKLAGKMIMDKLWDYPLVYLIRIP